MSRDQIIITVIQTLLLVLHAERKNKKVAGALTTITRVLRFVSQFQGATANGIAGNPESSSGSSSDSSSGSSS